MASVIDFSWPWIFLLLPLPLIATFVSHHRQVRSAGAAINVAPRLAAAFGKLENNATSTQRFSDSRFWRLILLWVAWLAVLTATAQPTRAQQTTAQAASGRALSMVIDLSTSMERRDFTINDETVDRLTVVKSIASQFINRRRGDRIGLVLFGTEAFIGSPLSYDLTSVNHALQSSGIGMAGRTTAIGDALGMAIHSLRNDTATEKAIVLLSDGTNMAGTAEPEDAARLAATMGIRVYTIGLGSDASSHAQQQFQSASADLDEDTLKAIANVSGGQFFRAHTSPELESIYREIDSLESNDNTAPPLIVRKDFRNAFIAIALVCLIALLLLDRLSNRAITK